MEDKKKRMYQFQLGKVGLREIRIYQSSTGMLLPFMPFVRLVRASRNSSPLSMSENPCLIVILKLQVKETIDSFTSDVNHWTPEVFVMLQSVS
jgi:histone H3/H4